MGARDAVWHRGLWLPERAAFIMRLMHVGLLVADLDRSAAFYEQVLGLKRAERPNLGFPGIFYRLEGGGQIHLMKLPDPCLGCERPRHGGRDDHLALGVHDLETVRARLHAHGVRHTLSRSGRKALFCRDPDGHAIELMQLNARA